MKPLKKLPTEVCSLVRSGVVIPTPSQAVMELVLNSIDAEATSIAVRVDLRLFKIQVIDNGHGITSEDLEAIGNRSVTSKCYTLDEFYNNLMYHGYRGESLASLREMCGLLEIVTRSSGCDNTYSKLFIHGKEEEIKISDLKRPTHGTTVTITDFMFNMPVRKERMKEVVELEAIRSCIECIALAHPEISISIRNDAKGRIILEKHKSSDLLNAFEHLFGHNLSRTLAAVNFSTKKFTINGYIGKESYRHNDMQFMYVNRQPVMKTKLHKLVCALLSKSSIIRTNGPWKNKPIPKNVPVERWLSFPSLEKNKKFAVFVINITCARKEYDICWDTKKPLVYFKDWEGILSCVSNAIREFLKIENLVEDGEDCNDGIVEDETRNYATTSRQKNICSTNDTVPQEISLKNNQQIEPEVETWNIQGAIHGISAKRRKERKVKLECKESNNQNSQSRDQIRRQLLTPDFVNSSVQIEEKIPPDATFLEKHRMPPATQLNISKDAYHLKEMEKEKFKYAEKLDKSKKEKEYKESDNQNLQSKDEISRHLLTPDSFNSSIQNKEESPPPVAKFLANYRTPVIQLNITKGAYRLKKMEEEQEKLKIAERLDEEKKAKLEFKESNDKNPQSRDQIRSHLLTSDSFNSSLQNKEESPPPVAKFLANYRSPPVIQLNITKGAYRLKRMEEEQEIAEKLEKERKEKLKYKESDNQNSQFRGQMRRQLLTPDSVDSSCLIEEDSPPTVAKFLANYSTPPVIHLNNSNGAYRLKKVEEEQQKIKVTEKLNKFKFSSKPKLCRLENKRNAQNKKLCDKFLKNEKTNDEISLMLRTKGPLKGNTYLKKKVHEQFNSSSSNTSSMMNKQDESVLSESILRNNVVDMDLVGDKNPVFMDLDSSLDNEYQKVPNYPCSPMKIDNSKTYINLEVSGVSTLAYVPDVCSENSNQNLNKETYEKSTRGNLSFAYDDVCKTNEKLHKINVSKKNVEYFRHQINTKRFTSVVCPDEKFTVEKHGCWNPHTSNLENNQEKERYNKSFNNVSSKHCSNLEVSEIMVVSIPTPQCKSVPIASVNSSELEDTPTCCQSVSVENQLDVTDYHENRVCSSEQSVLSLNASPSPIENSHYNMTNMNNESFVFEPDEHTFADCNSDGLSAMKFISSSLVFNSEESKLNDDQDTFNIQETPEDSSSVPHVSTENYLKNKVHTVSVGEQSNFIEPTFPSINNTAEQSKKVQNFKNIFDCFEKNLTHDSRSVCNSPYFTVKNTDNDKQMLKSSNFKQREKNNKQENDVKSSKNSTFVHNKTKEKYSGGMLSVFGAIESSQRKELFTDFPDSNEIIGKVNDTLNDSFNFAFSPCNLIKEPNTCLTEQMEVERELTCTENSALSCTGTFDIQPSVFYPDLTVDNLNDNTCISKKMRLSQDRCEEEDPKNIISSNCEEYTMRNEPFDSGTCLTSAEKNMNICEEKITFLQKEELVQKETRNSHEKIMEEDWLELKNFGGKLFYFHAPSGFTSYNPPSVAKDARLYSMTKRFHFLPKGMSPLLAASSTAVCGNSVLHADPTGISDDASELMRSCADKNDLKSVKWREKPDIFNDDISDVLDITKALSKKKAFPSNTTIPDLSFLSAKMSGMLLQQKFDKRIFTNIKVVGQLDNKFIITLCSLDKNSCPHILGIFDQHAVHERIRLEALMIEYSDGNDSFAATGLRKPIILTVSSKESHVMSSFQSKFEKLGLDFSVMDKDNIEIRRIPTCLYKRFLRERSSEWLEMTLHVLIQDVVLFLIKTGGQDCVVPEVFKDVINSEACKGAIKFGDPLSIVQCEDLLSMLSKCDLPFFCAHGRPSFMPILDLRQFEVERRTFVPGC